MSRPRCLQPTRWGAAAAVGLAVLGPGASSCDDRPTGAAAPPAAVATPDAAPTLARPQYLTGVPMARPTHLQLLMPGWFVDVDAGTRHPVAITRWLNRPSARPLLVEHVGQSSAQFARARVSTRAEPRMPAQPRVVRLAEPALGTVAPSADGKGLWVEEYRSRSRCTLREVGLDGRSRRPPRDVRCGTKPIGETRHGLWVAMGADAFIDATVGSGPSDWNAVLLDPDNFTERRRFPWVEIVDDDRFVAFLDPTYQSMELRDLRTGEATPLARPTPFGGPVPGP
jgi:hypothetical protein